MTVEIYLYNITRTPRPIVQIVWATERQLQSDFDVQAASWSVLLDLKCDIHITVNTTQLTEQQ